MTPDTTNYIPKVRYCPHCNSAKIQLMERPVAHEAESIVIWYECRACQRIWHREKAPLFPVGASGSHSRR